MVPVYVMLRLLVRCAVALLLLPVVAPAQATLIPSGRTPYRQKFDLQAQDMQFLLLPQSPMPPTQGPYRFHFESRDLSALLETAPTVVYVGAAEGGFVLQVLHLRPRRVSPEVLGPQRFVVESATGDRVGEGVLLVTGPAPEPVDLTGADASRSFELNRATEVHLQIRTHGNYAGLPVVLNVRDFELRDLREEGVDSLGVLHFSAKLRPLRTEATELRLAVETVDGRTVEVSYPGLVVRAPAPRRVRIGGGPVYLDGTGRGRGHIVVADFPAWTSGTPEVLGEGAGEVVVTGQRYDPEHRTLEADLEFVGRVARQPGTREVREIAIRAGTQTFRGVLEVVGPAQVTGVRVERSDRAVVPIGGTSTVIRVAGQNLDGSRLDCSSLGGEVPCRTLSATPGELVAEVALPASVREGSYVLELASAGARPAETLPTTQSSVRIQAEHPAIPMPLSAAPFLRLDCGGRRACEAAPGAESIHLRESAVPQLRLSLDETAVPSEHGWQKLLVTVTRVRGEQRQVVRTFGVPAAPRMLRHGAGGGEIPLLDAGADPRHGDLFIIRVEHAVEQYAPEYRTGLSSAEVWVRRVYVDGGAARRLTGDVVVQPVLFALGGGGEEKPLAVLYPNAGVGITWQFLSDHMEPRPYSLKLQLLATGLQAVQSERSMGGPAAFLSGNLRIPGTDPGRPLVVSAGVARMLGADPRWRVLAGAGIDLGVARMLFGS